jgi:hypothetical protein
LGEIAYQRGSFSAIELLRNDGERVAVDGHELTITTILGNAVDLLVGAGGKVTLPATCASEAVAACSAFSTELFLREAK